MLGMRNAFAAEFLHPTHLRNAACFMLLSTTDGRKVVVNVVVEHHDLLRHYEDAHYQPHYEFFHDRMLGLSPAAFNQKFETLLLFLVEAIGIPVLLSLLLLTYSTTGDADVLDLDELPLNRLQLYKLGIASGIRKRLTHVYAAGQSSGAVEVSEEQTEGAATKKREKRKGALEQNIGGDANKTQSADKQVARACSGADAVLDLNGVLRGKKVRVVQGEDDVAEAYSLVVRCLDRAKHADLRTAIGAIVPKSHSLHGVVTALVEFVLTPVAQNEAALQGEGLAVHLLPPPSCLLFAHPLLTFPSPHLSSRFFPPGTNRASVRACV
jgi:hypothetical protein